MSPRHLVRESSESVWVPRCYVPPVWEARVGWLEAAINWWHTWKAGWR